MSQFIRSTWKTAWPRSLTVLGHSLSLEEDRGGGQDTTVKVPNSNIPPLRQETVCILYHHALEKGYYLSSTCYQKILISPGKKNNKLLDSHEILYKARNPVKIIFIKQGLLTSTSGPILQKKQIKLWCSNYLTWIFQQKCTRFWVNSNKTNIQIQYKAKI